MKVAVPAASLMVTLLMLKLGVGSLSTIVVVTLPLVALIARLSKLPPVKEAMLTVKFSAASFSASSSVAKLKLTLLLPTGIVTVACPVKSIPSTAVPL